MSRPAEQQTQVDVSADLVGESVACSAECEVKSHTRDFIQFALSFCNHFQFPVARM